jgi:hypothetical protein
MPSARLTDLLMRARLWLSKRRCPLLRHSLDQGVLDQYLTGAYIS